LTNSASVSPRPVSARNLTNIRNSRAQKSASINMVIASLFSSGSIKTSMPSTIIIFP